MSNVKKANAVGINHISIEVGNVAEAVEFYSSFLNFEVCYEDDLGIPKEEMASIELGDQFIAMTRSDRQHRDVDRHIGLVVDDKETVRQALIDMGVDLIVNGPTMGFIDPWGNRIEIVSYQNISYTKPEKVLKSMGIDKLDKSEKALAKLKREGWV